MTEQMQMTREQATSELTAHLEDKKADLKREGLDLSFIDEAIRQLKAGNPEPALDLMLEDDLHLQYVECGEYDNPEFGEKWNKQEREMASKERDRMRQWLVALHSEDAAQSQ